MYVIAVYDVSTNKNNKILKLLRQYLFHVQNSVFEGNISENLYMELKAKLNAFTYKGNEQIVIYKIPTEKALKKDILSDKTTLEYEIV